MSNEHIILGTFESVDFPGFGVKNITAKIDTGAYTGAMHCSKIEIRETEQGKMLYFEPFDNKKNAQLTTDYYRKTVKSSNGTREVRFIVSTEITIQDQTYPILLSLTDRSSMKYPVLVGRRFLRSHKMVVDATKYKK